MNDRNALYNLDLNGSGSACLRDASVVALLCEVVQIAIACQTSCRRRLELESDIDIALTKLDFVRVAVP
jgi:hypothetical protein